VPRPQDEPTIESRYDNTIEPVLRKLKAILRAEADRTVSEPSNIIKRAFTRFSNTKCRNYLSAPAYINYDPNRSDAAEEI
jgi:hypothetical protein